MSVFRPLLLIAALLFSSQVYAACNTPNGNEGDIVYNKDYSVVQLCNASGNWIALGGNGNDGTAEIDPKIGSLTNGKWCTSNGTQVTCGSDAPSSALSGLSDVTLTTPTNGDILSFNGTNWVNSTANSGLGDRITSNTAYVQANTGGTVTISGTTYINNATGADAALLLGRSPTGNKNAYIDLVGDTTYSTYGLRLIRVNTGANANSWIRHRGTGALLLSTEDSGPIVFNTSGTESMRIAPNGNVAINGALDVSGSVIYRMNNNQGIFRFTSGASANYLQSAATAVSGDFKDFIIAPYLTDYAKFIIKGATGNVGISVTNPTEKLEVAGNVKATAFIGDGSLLTNLPASGGATDRITSNTAYVQANTNGTVSISGSTHIGNGTGTDVTLLLGRSPTGSRSAYIDLVGDTTYTAYGLRIIRNNTGANANSWIRHRGTGALLLSTEDSGPIVFNTSSTESMRILANGKVAIGTISSPSGTLHVFGSGGPSSIALSRNTNVNEFGVWDYNSSTMRFGTTITDHLGFITNNLTRMYISAAGNIGISTTNPTEKLEVNGNVKATAFIGDGSQLTNLPGGTSDRIVSGTLAQVIAQSGGTVQISSTSTYFNYGGNNQVILKVGAGATGDRTSYLDLLGDTTYTTYGLRLSRSGGANGGSYLLHRGTGGLFLRTEDNAPIILTTAGNESMRITPNGNVGINVTAPTAKLEVVGLISSSIVTAVGSNEGDFINLSSIGGGTTGRNYLTTSIRRKNGNINLRQQALHTNGTTAGAYTEYMPPTISNNFAYLSWGYDNTAYMTLLTDGLSVTGNITYTGTLTDISDRRLKTNIEPLPFTSATQKLSQLAAVQFEMKDKLGVKEYGFIAQDVEKVLPSLVFTAKDPSGTKSLNYMGLIPVLVQANQELAKENAALKATQADILKRLEALEKRP